MMRVVPGVLLLLLLIACRPPEGGSGAAGGYRLPVGLEANLTLDGPAQVGPVPVRLQLAGTGPLAVGSVTITGNMTHAGMVPVIVQAEQLDESTWLAAGFAFNMGGDWFLLADVTLADGTTFDVTLPVSVRSN